MPMPYPPLPTVNVRLSRSIKALKLFVSKESRPILKRRKQITPIKRIKITYSMDQHMVIVYLRHRSLTQFDHRWHRWCEIARMTGVK